MYSIKKAVPFSGAERALINFKIFPALCVLIRDKEKSDLHFFPLWQYELLINSINTFLWRGFVFLLTFGISDFHWKSESIYTYAICLSLMTRS